MFPGRVSIWRGVAIVLVGLVASSCSVVGDDVAVSRADRVLGGGATSQGVTDGLLPAVGPVPGSSHWHAAYVFRICDQVLDPFESKDDPLGIHSHGDGLMHIHPFFAASGYEQATLGLFADAMGFELATGELTLPGGGTWRDGDLCNGVPGRVFVDRWSEPDPESEVVRIFDAPGDIRYQADGELYQIAFAPIDSLPVVPPSTAQLAQVSNLSPPPEPWVDMPIGGSQDDIRVWPVDAVASEPCTGSALPERVTQGSVRCFTPGTTILSAVESFAAARAVMLNRQPAVEMRVLAPFEDLVAAHFARSQDPFAFAIEIDGSVLTAPLLTRPPLGDRLVISGGFSVQAAQLLADALNGQSG